MNDSGDHRPVGGGLKLGDVSGDSLRLAVVGYQFQNAEDLRKRYSWHEVEGEATVAGSAWSFRSAALTCDTSPLLSEWFRSVAMWVSSGLEAEKPKAPWLIEPNLQFPEVRREGDVAVLTVELDLEFLSPERRRGRVGAGNPVGLEILTTPRELVQAATDFDATIARWPGAPAEG